VTAQQVMQLRAALNGLGRDLSTSLPHSGVSRNDLTNSRYALGYQQAIKDAVRLLDAHAKAAEGD